MNGMWKTSGMIYTHWAKHGTNITPLKQQNPPLAAGGGGGGKGAQPLTQARCGGELPPLSSATSPEQEPAWKPHPSTGDLSVGQADVPG